MTPKRAKAFEAVAEAARVWSDTPLSHNINEEQALVKALAALDALPAEPADAGEMVEVIDVREVALQAIASKLAAVPKPRSYEMAHYCMGLEDAAMAIRDKIHARIPRPVVPEIRVEVET